MGYLYIFLLLAGGAALHSHFSEETSAIMTKVSTDTRHSESDSALAFPVHRMSTHNTESVPKTYLDEKTDRIIIKFRNIPDTMVSRARDSASNALAIQPVKWPTTLNSHAIQSAKPIRVTLLGATVWKLDRAYPLHELTRLTTQLAQYTPNIEYAEPDRRVKPATYDSERAALTSLSWNLGGSAINAPELWKMSTGLGVTVAVLDSGYLPHPDLLPNIVGGYDMISDAHKSNKGGKTRSADATDPGDWTTDNECNDNKSAQDSSWHGTHVAGTIAARPNAIHGTAGIAYDADILPVRVLGKCGGYDSDIVDGIVWAAGAYSPSTSTWILNKLGLGQDPLPTNPYPARVINLSLGAQGRCTRAYQEAFDAVRKRGATVVVAAGNEHALIADSVISSCQGIISVGAMGANGQVTSFSNFGVTANSGETIFAPGDDILSTFNDGKMAAGDYTYAKKSGTSMAAPHVSGVIALMLAINPSLTPEQVTRILQDTAQPLPTSVNRKRVMLNAFAAVRTAAEFAKSLSAHPSAAQQEPSHYYQHGVHFYYPELISEASCNMTPPLNIGASKGGWLYKDCSIRTINNITRSSHDDLPMIFGKLHITGLLPFLEQKFDITGIGVKFKEDPFFNKDVYYIHVNTHPYIVESFIKVNETGHEKKIGLTCDFFKEHKTIMRKAARRLVTERVLNLDHQLTILQIDKFLAHCGEQSDYVGQELQFIKAHQVGY